MTKSEIIKVLEMTPLSIEGGYFKEVFRDTLALPKSILPSNFKADSYCASSSIYYLLSSADTSSMHAVSASETWHFYKAGDESVFLELLVISPEGAGQLVRLGSKIENGEVPQFTVPANWWMGARIRFKEAINPDYAWALTGATVAPSFEYKDFIKGDAEKIAKLCPKYAELIKILG